MITLFGICRAPLPLAAANLANDNQESDITPNDVDIIIGTDNGPAAAGMAELRNMVEREGRGHRKEPSRFFPVGLLGGLGGAIGYFSSLIEKAHEIHHEAERFGPDAQQMQLIGNAAKESGASLEATARAMGKLEPATALRLKGNDEMATAFR